MTKTLNIFSSNLIYIYISYQPNIKEREFLVISFLETHLRDRVHPPHINKPNPNWFDNPILTLRLMCYICDIDSWSMLELEQLVSNIKNMKYDSKVYRVSSQLAGMFASNRIYVKNVFFSRWREYNIISRK